MLVLLLLLLLRVTAESMRTELENQRSSLTTVVRDIEVTHERLQGEVGQVRNATRLWVWKG